MQKSKDLHAESKLDAILFLDLPNFGKDWFYFILNFQILNLQLLFSKIMLLPFLDGLIAFLNKIGFILSFLNQILLHGFLWILLELEWFEWLHQIIMHLTYIKGA